MRLRLPLVLWLAGLLSASSAGATGKPVVVADLLAQGEYIFRAAGCYGCHTDEKRGGKALAGGRALETPFGVFYSPNITPDPDSGIGKWSEADFIRALREGLSPKGEQYYPAFPYPSYTLLTDDDLRALWVYLRSQPAVQQKNRAHELKWYARARSFVGSWKALYFVPGPYRPDASRSASWNRGAYLAEAAAHCGECHTPRTLLGGVEADRAMAGTYNASEKALIPNITPDPETGIGKWSEADIVTALKMGMLPDGDFVGSLMTPVVNEGTSKLSDADIKAMAVYLRSLPPIRNRPAKPANSGAARK